MGDETAPVLHWTSSAATARGPRHAVNEDSYGSDDDVGLFVVADGVGGHAEGDFASGAVVGLLHGVLAPDQDLETRVDLVEEALASVNAALWVRGQGRPEADIVASTVVVLLIGEGFAACLWAGDSRIYLYRDEHLYQLTRDHNLAVEFGATGQVAGHLTRAVGSAEQIEVERVVTATMPGDVFLLCSDGVTKVLDEAEIAGFLDSAIEGVALRIIGAVVDRGSEDDATAIVIRGHHG